MKCSIGDEGMKTLSRILFHLDNLEHLDLKSNNIGDKGCRAFFRACTTQALPNLGSLELSLNPIGSMGIRELAWALSNGALIKLEELYMYGVSNERLEEFAKDPPRGIVVVLVRHFLS